MLGKVLKITQNETTSSYSDYIPVFDRVSRDCVYFRRFEKEIPKQFGAQSFKSISGEYHMAT